MPTLIGIAVGMAAPAGETEKARMLDGIEPDPGKAGSPEATMAGQRGGIR